MKSPIANAPVTWGVWGPHSLPEGRSPRDILKALGDAGYDGVELGPLGFFGADAGETRAALDEFSLACAGVYVPLRPLHGREVMKEDIANLHAVCKVLGVFEKPGPLILAEETEKAIQSHVRRGNRFPELDLSAADWKILIDGMVEGAAIVADYGLETSYHPHTGTHVEQAHEVDRFLQGCDLMFTLDTAHAAAGGDDPVDLLRRWRERLNHVHIKDMIYAPVEKASAAGTHFGIASASVALGEGELDLDTILRILSQTDYAGWLVIEQDRHPEGGHDHGAVDKEQQRNLAWLRKHAR